MKSQVQSAENLRKSFEQSPSMRWLSRLYETLGYENTAYISMFLSQILWPLSFLYINQNNFNPIESTLLRGTIVIIFNYLVCVTMGFQITFKQPQIFKSLIIRNGIMIIHGLVFFSSQFFLPQTTLLTIYSSGPIFVYLFDYYSNGVTINKDQVIGLIISIFGVFLTINCGIILQYFDPNHIRKSDFQNYYSDDPKIIFTFAIILTFTEVLWGRAVIQTKKLGSINAIQINLHLGILLIVSSGLLYPSCVKEKVSIGNLLMSVLATGIPQTIGQLLFINALALSKNHGTLTMITFISVVCGYFVSILRYNESFNPISSMGSILIIFGVARIILKKQEEKQKQKQKQKLTV